MAKLVTKIQYLRPNGKRSVGGYATYIATREGVDKIDRSRKDCPATEQQKLLISKLLHDFPDCVSMPEYEDYRSAPTVENASEFISRALEDNGGAVSRGGYAEYIALRPRSERFGSHGLFTDVGMPVELSKVASELDRYDGNVWTIILSLRREDAERLGFNRGERWRDMIRSETTEIAKAFRIPLTDLKWYAAFHNESHHPHVHIMVYSAGRKPYLTKDAVWELRASFARDIFAQDLLCVYEKQTEHRNALRMSSREKVAQIVDAIKAGGSDDPLFAEKLYRLAVILSHTKGKKQYGYLKADVKALVCSIVDDLAADPRISELYDLWYSQREEVIRTYTDEMPERVPLSENREFRSVLNAVVREAERLTEQSSVNFTATEQAVLTASTASALRLLRQVSRVFETKIDENKPTGYEHIDRKLLSEIAEKKLAHGQKLG